MIWQDALEIMVARTKHERYRWLCSNECEDHDQWRGFLAKKASELPPLIQQAGNALEAVGRAVGAVLAGEPVLARHEEQERRWAICAACEYLVADRCTQCGCHMRAKTALAQEKCPIGKW